MNFYYRYANISKIQKAKIDETLKHLQQKLENIDIEKLGISEYNQVYFKKHIKDFQKTSWYLSHIFSLVMEQNKSLENTVLIDYGGGTGILSYFAKMLGVGTVIYNDIYEVSCADIEKISESLDIKTDHIVCGDINEVVNYTNTNNLNVDFLVSFDVIEHIYDVESWFLQTKNIKSNNLKIIQTSHANKYNLLINRKLKKIQKTAELKDRVKSFGHKERDSLKSFFALRKEIIKQHLPEVSDKTIEKLSKQTRGLIEKDIVEQIQIYKKQRVISYKPNHKTNTCDPCTGNWSEQFIDLPKLKQALQKQGIFCKISSGFYISTKGNFIVRVIKKVVNYSINLLGVKGLYLAPYYVIVS